MDAYKLSILLSLTSIAAICVVVYLIWREEREAKRARSDTDRRMKAIQGAFALAAADKEVSRRARLPAITTPLPNLKGTK